MVKYHYLSASLLLMSTALTSINSPAAEVLYSTHQRQVYAVPTSSYTIEYINVPTQRHGQGTFTIYRPPAYPAKQPRVTIIKNGVKQGRVQTHTNRSENRINRSNNRTHRSDNRNHRAGNRVNRFYNQPDRRAGIQYYHPNTTGSFGHKVYRPRSSISYNSNYGLSVNINSNPSHQNYYQQPVRVFQYYPNQYPRQFHQAHQYQQNHRQVIQHYNIQQCLGPGCNKRNK